MKKIKGLYKLTFSQREGKAPLPEPMRLEHVSKDFRNLVWLAIYKIIREESINDSFYHEGASMLDIVPDYIVRALSDPHDHINDKPFEHQKFLQGIIRRGSYDKVLTLVEFILCHNLCPTQLQYDLENAFKEVPIAYTIQTVNGLPTIVPRSSEESGTATQQAIETIEQKGPAGAKTHLRDAAEAINEKRYADAVRESIHAVESVARTIDPKASKTLRPALRSLEAGGVLKHPALQEACIKLYKYTSDENGIRHALLDERAAYVDLDDAVFMFGACASFAAYLVNRHKQLTT
ncbi:MAG: hypothetical protein F4184_16320 [Gemmatimonadetes bacterium]|nr:hypothetical protein [Gemmatimonadota bacterium]